jgi:hypothetical protein
MEVKTMNGCGAPYFYNYINAANSVISPSTVHCKNTGLQRYFARYLIQKAISVFKWKIPENWAENYFLYSLYTWGYVAVVNTDKFGVIVQACALRGYDIYYQPTHAIITNPLLTGILEPRIGKQCALLRLQPDYGGIMDKVNFYADMMALCAETIGTNILNSKLSYIFAASSKNDAESFKKMFDKVASGEPAAFIGKDLFNEDGSPNWMQFNQDLKNTYVADEIMIDLRKWEQEFCRDLGINNANTEKKERMIVDEVASNNEETLLWSDLTLEQLKKDCKKARDMFGIELDVDYRFKQDPQDNMGQLIQLPERREVS